jgi:Na+/proline symporter
VNGLDALERPLIIAAASVYLLLVLAVGFWSARRTKTAKDFWIAGQNIGLLTTGLATTSAAFSGFVFLGGPGLTYQLGTGSLFIVVAGGFTASLMCWVLAKRLRLLAGVREVYTIPDAILVRYRSRAASGIAAVAVIMGTIAYLGSQFLALGRLIEAVFGTRELIGAQSLAVAVIAGVIVVVLYSGLGGMIAGVYTDLLQGSLMTLVAGVVFVHAIVEGGGVARIATSIASSEAFGPSFLEPLGRVPVLTAVGFYFVFAIGILGQPHMLHKFYMIDDPRKLKWIPIVVGGTQTLCVLIWLGLGLVVPALVAQGRLAPLAQPDDAAAAYLLNFAPTLLAGVVFAGILAAIMSTADSFVNIGSAALVRDLPRAIGRPVTRELFWGRIAVVGIAAAAAALAIGSGDLIAILGTFAFGTFGAALAPALAIGLNWRRVTATAAISSMLVGIVVNLGLEVLARNGVVVLRPGVLPTAVSLAASFSVLLVVSWMSTPDPDAIDEDVALVMDA